MKMRVVLFHLIIWGAVFGAKAQTADSLKLDQQLVIPAEQGTINRIPMEGSGFDHLFRDIPAIEPGLRISLEEFHSTTDFPLLKTNPGALDFTRSLNLKQSFYVNKDLLGYYRQGKFKLNENISFYSKSVLPGKTFKSYLVPTGNLPQFQYGTTFEVGYKVSDKFSIRAGFSVGRYEYP